MATKHQLSRGDQGGAPTIHHCNRKQEEQLTRKWTAGAANQETQGSVTVTTRRAVAPGTISLAVQLVPGQNLSVLKQPEQRGQ